MSPLVGVAREIVQRARDEYPDPLPFLTAEAFVRAHHDDVVHLTDVALECERYLAHRRRAVELFHARRTTEWLAARVERLDAEAARRRSRRR
jgi:hypothetical protein